MPKLTVMPVDGDTQTWDLKGERITIGRKQDNHVWIRNIFVSSHHAELARVDDAYEIRDLGSRNGLTVNGKRVQKAMLSDGDRIGFGLLPAVYAAAAAPKAKPGLKPVPAPAPAVNAGKEKALEEKRKALDARESELAGKEKALQIRTGQAESEASELAKTLRARKAELKPLDEKKLALEKEIGALEERLAEAEADIRSKESKIEELDEVIAEKGRLSAASAPRTASPAPLPNASTNPPQSMVAEMEAIGGMVKSRRGELSALEAKVAAAAAEEKRLKASIREIKNEVTAKSAALSALTASVEKKRAALTALGG